MNTDTYVIVPVYNEGQVLGPVIKGLKNSFRNIVCVNDGSRDNTEKVITKSGAILVNHPINLGQGAAIQTGVSYALNKPNAEYFITFDADGQHSIKDALKMLSCLKRDNLDIVLGSRFLGEAKNISRAKKQLLKTAIVFSRLTTGVKLTDSNVGLRAFNRNFAENLNLTMNDMAHATEIVDRIKRYNYKYREIPITVTYTTYSKSKGQPMLNSVNIAADVFMKRIVKW